MRYDTCLNCQAVEDPRHRDRSPATHSGRDHRDAGYRPGAPPSHRSPARTAEPGGSTTFATGGLGLPVAARRDTVLCACPEDGINRYAMGIIQIPVPEAECNCTAAEVNGQRRPDPAEGAEVSDCGQPMPSCSRRRSA